MPSYMVTYEGKGLTTIKSYVAYNLASVIEAAIAANAEKKKPCELIRLVIEKQRD